MRFPPKPRRAAIIAIAALLLLIAAGGIVQAQYDALPHSDELEELWAAVDELKYLVDEVYFLWDAVEELENKLAETTDEAYGMADEAYGMADEAWFVAELTYEDVSALATRVVVLETALGIPPTSTATPTATPTPSQTPTPIPDAVFERAFQVITCDKGYTRPGSFPMIAPRITGDTEVSLTERQRLFPNASDLVNWDALLLGCDVSGFLTHKDAVKNYLFLLYEIRQICNTNAELIEQIVVTKTMATIWTDGPQKRALPGFEEEVPFMPSGQLLVTYAAAARDEGLCPSTTPTATPTATPTQTPTPIPDAVFERAFQVITCDKGYTRPGSFPMIAPRITGDTEVSLTERQRLFPNASDLVNRDALLLGCDVSGFLAHKDAVKNYLYLLYEIRQICNTGAELIEAVVVMKTMATIWTDGPQKRALPGFEEEVPFMPSGQLLVTYAAAARDEGLCPSWE